ncbi:uncharacterized protein [Amphiura filiformis]|uniref:uncharacterized protein n=1 Tax=Amphiura filiformis TaxID=82378 RepID=UPI003B22098F
MPRYMPRMKTGCLILIILSALSTSGRAQLVVEVIAPDALAGAEAVWSCKFEHTGIADVKTVYWKVGDKPNLETLIYYRFGVIDGDQKDRLQMSNTTFDLTIPIVEYPLDENRYWCSASTTSGGSNDDDAITFVSVQPTVTLEPEEDIQIDPDMEYTFSCNAIKARPTATIIWTLGDIPREDILNCEPPVNTPNEDDRFNDTLSVCKLNSKDITETATLQCKAKVPPADEVGVTKEINLIAPEYFTSTVQMTQETTEIEVTTNEAATTSMKTEITTLATTTELESVISTESEPTDKCICEDDDALCCLCGKGKRCIDGVCTEVKMLYGSASFERMCREEDLDIAARNASRMLDEVFNHTDYKGNCPTDAKCGSLIVEFQIFYDINSDLTIDEIEQIINDGFEEAGVPISKPFKTFRAGVKSKNQGLIIGLCVAFAVLGVVVIVGAIVWIKHRSKNKVADDSSSTPRAEEKSDDKKEDKKDDDDT